MTTIASIGLDIAKETFHIFAADEAGETAINKKLKRAEVIPFFQNLPPTLIGIEACNTSHYWARTISSMGHIVRLIHPSYVKDFVTRGKTDAIDAEAIQEAVSRRNMRFVPIKSVDQQAVIMIFRTRTLLLRQKVQSSNALRNHLAEFGIITGAGMHNIRHLIECVKNSDRDRLPLAATCALDLIVEQIQNLDKKIHELDRTILRLARQDDDMRRLMTIPGVGPLTAAAVRTAVSDPTAFKSSRHFASWLGLVPKIYSSGGKTYHGRISKMGDSTLRSLLVVGAASALRVAKEDNLTGLWLLRLKERRPFRVVIVALANKIARIIWALLVKGGVYSRQPLAGDCIIREPLNEIAL